MNTIDVTADPDCALAGLLESERRIVETKFSWGISPREEIEQNMQDGVDAEQAAIDMWHVYRMEGSTIQALMNCVAKRATGQCPIVNANQ